MNVVEQFVRGTCNPPVRGFLHRPTSPSGDGLVLTHGAGGNAKMALLVALAEAFAGAGFTVLRCDMPFRQARPFGPPRPGDAARDRAGLANAVAAMRELVPGRVFLGGQSYGGRQASMLLAEQQTPKSLTTEDAGLHRETATGRASLQRPTRSTEIRSMACCCFLIPCTRRVARSNCERSISPNFTFLHCLWKEPRILLPQSRRSKARAN